MEGKEKQILVTVINTVVIFIAYAYYVYTKQLAHDPSLWNDAQFWGKTFIVLIPVAIVAQIVVHIIFSIINKIVTNEDMPMKDDERDKLIELKSIRVAHWIFTIGFLTAMITQAMGMEIGVMFITLVIAGSVSGVVSELVKLYYYRKGI